MEHAELSSSVIFVCHVNFSRRLEAESAAISVLFYSFQFLNLKTKAKLQQDEFVARHALRFKDFFPKILSPVVHCNWSSFIVLFQIFVVKSRLVFDESLLE